MDSADELAKLTQQLTQTQLAYQQALQLSHYKGTFLARTSHELRSPLSSLMGLQQLILADLCESPEEERDFVQQAHAAAQRLLALLDQLVYVSKLEHGTNQLNLYPLELQHFLAEVKELTHLQAANKGYALDIASAEAGVLVQGDQKRLVQMLVSLIDTAIDSMQMGSLHLTNEVQEHQVQLVLTVQSPEIIWSMAQILNPPTAKIDALASLEPNIDQHSAVSMSPSLTWMLADAVVQQMGGQLKLIHSPAVGDELTMVQIVLLQGTILDPELE